MVHLKDPPKKKELIKAEILLLFLVLNYSKSEVSPFLTNFDKY